VPDRKPLLIYDGHCGFCKIWIDYWKRITGDRIDYAPSQEVGGQFPQIPAKAFSQSVQLVRPDGTVISGARAVFETLGHEKSYERARVLAWIAEGVYGFIAARRTLSYWVTRIAFGTRIEPSRFETTQWIFLRLLAVVYAIAFLSLSTQITGLIGARGILPLHDFMDVVAKSLGPQRFFVMPTVFWADSSDPALTGACWAGLAFSILLFFGRIQKLSLIALFVLYLSLSVSGQDFLQFQWDSLLLEAGFLAIFLGRAQIVVWLFRWLVFRLLFMSGSVKLLSGDPTWHKLTALDYHYHTQPLPTVLAWYADKLPEWFQKFSTLLVLIIETAVPFLIFTPRRLRMFAASCIIGLEILIALTGNYTFFNLLTIVLCVFLFDDQALKKWSGLAQTAIFRPRRPPSTAPMKPAERIFAGVFAAVIAVLGFTHVLDPFGVAPDALRTLARAATPFEIVNSYGLFAVMTTTRPEIIVEGSPDGETWTPYEFRYKPGDLMRAPRWVAPFQPRLDWQMWFAALSNYRQNIWFIGFAAKLLEGSPDVQALIEKNPFPGLPPRYIRAQVYEYSFTTWSEHRQTGTWWKRKPLGMYLPPIGMKAK
jgi:predicted DCC family thiol-disulfide oxidoreductase YuxK